MNEHDPDDDDSPDIRKRTHPGMVMAIVAIFVIPAFFSCLNVVGQMRATIKHQAKQIEAREMAIEMLEAEVKEKDRIIGEHEKREKEDKARQEEAGKKWGRIIFGD